MPTPILSHVIPILPVSNIQETIEFYSGKLGFDDIWTWGDPFTELRVRRGKMGLLFTLDPKRALQTKGIDIMIFLTGINVLYTEYQSSDLSFSSHIEDKPWGTREFAIQDNNGYYLRFAQGLDYL